MADYTNRQKAIVLIPKVGGVISVLSSFYIFQHVIKSPKRRSTLYHRLLAVMSACDMVGSSIFILSTWPIPKESGVYLASGTTQTCTAVGFINQTFAYMTPAFNVSLALYYYLCVVKGFKEDHITKHYQHYMYSVPVVLAFATSVPGLPLKLYNNANFLCWIAPHPPGCKDSWTYGDEGDCERGDNADIYRLAFLYAHLWLFMLVNLYFMVSIYLAVLQQEKTAQKYVISDQRNSSVLKWKHSRRVAAQGALYIVAFYLTFLPGSITRLRQMVKGKVEYGILINMVILFPLQGFFNFLVYFYPRYKRFRQQKRRERKQLQNQQKQQQDGNNGTTTATNSEEEGKSGRSFFMTLRNVFFNSTATSPHSQNTQSGRHENDGDDNYQDGHVGVDSREKGDVESDLEEEDYYIDNYDGVDDDDESRCSTGETRHFRKYRQ